jgi:hypothetical protein
MLNSSATLDVVRDPSKAEQARYAQDQSDQMS